MSEATLLRELVRKIIALQDDASLICDEVRWGNLLDSDDYKEALRHITDDDF